jgi:lipopolysaccharide export system permease protein
MPRIIYRYILKEICLVFAVSLITFTFILLVAKIFTFTDLIVNKGVSPIILIDLIVYKLPYFFVFTFPMSTLMGTLVTFLRLSHDHEITALKASGVSLVQLLPPVLTLSFFALLTTTFMAVYLMPEGNRAFKTLVHTLGQQKAYVGISPRIFVDDFAGLVLYANGVDTSGRGLDNIFIADERDPELSHAIVARKGIILENPTKKGLVLRLLDGEIHFDSKDLKSSDTVQFKSYELAMDVPDLVAGADPGEPGESEMSLKQLWEKIRSAEKKDPKYNMLVMELHEKFALPFSSLILGLIGLSLAVRTRAHGYSAGVAMALGVFLCYYILLSAVKSLGESGTLPPALGMWLPDILLGTLSMVMFVQACRETPMKSLAVLSRSADGIRAIIRRLGGLRRP